MMNPQTTSASTTLLVETASTVSTSALASSLGFGLDFDLDLDDHPDLDPVWSVAFREKKKTSSTAYQTDTART